MRLFEIFDKPGDIVTTDQVYSRNVASIYIFGQEFFVKLQTNKPENKTSCYLVSKLSYPVYEGSEQIPDSAERKWIDVDYKSEQTEDQLIEAAFIKAEQLESRDLYYYL